jgi:pSer/pThr/pTyr-binding forkhead associated (FHA) protein
MTTHVCPKGHLSADSDYCDQCGTKIQTTNDLLADLPAGANPWPDLTSTEDPFAAPAAIPTTSGGAAIACPACGAMHEASDGNFCEICGYNFSTGQTADLPIATLTPPPVDPTPVIPAIAPIILPSSTTGWTITIRIDPSLATANSPPAPTQAPIVLPLNQTTSLIGRTSAVRGVLPEIPLDWDDAISHRHALLIVQADGSLIVRDVGSSNGVQFKGQDLAAMADVPLQSGDVFSLGHWTTIAVDYQNPVK